MHSRLVAMTAVAVIAGTLSAARLRAQTPPAAAPAFEVASVKANKSGPQALQRIDMRPRDRVTINNVPLRVLVQTAYRLAASRIVGGPNWIGSDRFDNVAKAEAPTSQNQLELMLRTLLADHFKLVFHTETRDEAVYMLVIARSDRKLGPNLHPAVADCATLRAKAVPGPQANGFGPCGNLGGIPPGTQTIRGLDIAQLAGLLSREAGRKVVDKTGLTGNFDWDLKWTPQAFQERPFDRQRFTTVDPDGPSIFTAVQEQLGLKLESQQDKGEFLVIDSLEHPTED